MDAIEFRIERLILKAGNALNNIRTKDLSDNNLTSVQSETILFYAANEGSNIKDLAAHLKITHQAARKLVVKLKEKGILETEISAGDRRNTCIRLTEGGSALCGKLKKKGTSNGEILLKGFSDNEKQLLAEYLVRIEKNITGK